MSYLIREATENDYEDIQNLCQKVVREYLIDDYPDEKWQHILTKLHSVEEIKRNIDEEEAYHIVAFNENSELVGTGCLIDKNYMSRIYIRQDYHGKGLGKLIMRRLEEYHNQKYHINGIIPYNCHLHLWSLKRALPFYLSLGYHIGLDVQEVNMYTMNKICEDIKNPARITYNTLLGKDGHICWCREYIPGRVH
ncbi:hypothetical protein WA158_000720 [Blastocystis sp. Blastoise]